MKRYAAALVLVCASIPALAFAEGEPDPRPAGSLGDRSAPASEGRRAPVARPVFCGYEPDAPGCPKVTKVVRAQPGDGGYGPDPARAAAARRPKARAAAVPPGYACAVRANAPVKVVYPSGNEVVRSIGLNDCLAGVGVTYQQLIVTNQRYQDSRWTSMNSNSVDRAGSGTIQQQAQYDCQHQSTYAYRTEALGYSVVKGVGYLGTDYAYANQTCFP